MGHLRHLFGKLEAFMWDAWGVYVGHLRHLCGTLEALLWGT